MKRIANAVKTAIAPTSWYRLRHHRADKGALGVLKSPLFVFLLLLFSSFWSVSHAAEKCPEKPKNLRAAKKLATRLYKKGIAHYRAGRYKRAEHTFKCTQRILPADLTLYWIGRTSQKLGKHRTALDIFLALEENPPKVLDKEDLTRRIAELAKKTSGDLSSNEPNKKDPHKVPGSKSRKDRKKKAHADTESNEANLRARSRRERSMEIGTWTTWSAGAVLILTGTVLGSLAIHDQRKIENAADGVYWDSELEKRYERRQNLVPGSWVCISLGIGAVAAGTLLYFLRGKEKKEKLTTWQLTPLKGGAMAGMELKY